jgi:peroxiredoxin
VLVGIAAVVLLAVVGVSALRAGGGPAPARLAAGDPAPPFAAPLALGDLEGDANVATPDTAGGEAGRVPACEVREADALNACALWRRRPVALAFFSERSADCVEEVDRLQAAATRHPGVAVAAVAIRGDRERLRELIATRGWKLPVALDRDGILADLYGVVVCPQVAFVARGGRIAATSAGSSPRAELERRLAALEP